MIRRAVFMLAVCGMCVTSMVHAADLPAYPVEKTLKPVKRSAKPKQIVLKAPRAATVKSPQPLAKKAAVTSPKIAIEPTGSEVNLTWMLDPLVANSDGAKREDSAGVEANLIVTEPGTSARPAMVIELTGHVIKTARTTVRLDIRVGRVRRIVNWNSDDVQSGKFQISLSGAMTEDKLPEYFPVSALAFVTKDGKEGAAMVSLEKVVVRLGNAQLADTIKDPATAEVTGSISTD